VAAHAKEDAVSESKRKLDELIERLELRRALSALDDPELGGALSKPKAQLLRGRALAGLEQFHTAYGLFTEVRGERDLSALDRVEAQYWSARVLRRASPLIDFALELSQAAAESGARAGARGQVYAVWARVESALLFARKRCPKLAQAELDKARSFGVELSRTYAGEAEVALSFDDRAAARRSYEAALGTDDARGPRIGHLGLARLLTLAGEFEVAEQHLRELEPAAALDLPLLRVKSELLSSQAKWDELAAVLEAIVLATPDGDSTRSTMYERAGALYRAGRRDDATNAWRELAALDGYYGKLASRMLEKTKNAEAAAERLAAFPSVSQLRNHCGPASVELCLRFFGTAANQVDVAREIKHPDGGTPVHRMRWYMDRAGFATRRVEADLPKLKAILAAGIPVILEEDYSMSRHVAVAIGYDDRRELLEVQDPMTHEVRETFYEDLPRLREFSNHGALVAIPQGRSDLSEALDRIGAVECAYMTKTDEAWQAFDDGNFEQSDQLIDEVMQLHEPYELAWVHRFVRARQAFRAATDDAARAEPLERMKRLVTRSVELWPNDEWPQQYLGQLHELQNDSAEALAAFERARDRDPADANNHCSIGDALLALGRRDDARKAFETALERQPSHVRANENLSDLALENGDSSLSQLLNACALEHAPDNAFNHGVRGRLLAQRGDHAGAAQAFAAAKERAPSRPYYAMEHARELARSGQVDEGLASFRALASARPDDVGCLVQWADLAYELSRPADSLEACALLEKLDDEHPALFAISGAARCKAGELEAGLVGLRRALQLSPIYGWVYREMGRHLAAAGRHDEALTAFAANCGVAPSVQATCLFASALIDAKHPDSAVGLYKRVARSGEMSERDFSRLGLAIRRASGASAAHGYFQELTEDRPRDRGLLSAHVRLLVEELWAPRPAAKPLSKLAELDAESPFVLARQGDDLMDASLEAEPRGEELLRQAMAAAPELVYPRRLLVRQLNQRGRFDEALALGESARLDGETLEDRVESLLGLEREADARAAIEAYAQTLPEDERDGAVAPLHYRLAEVARRHEEALAHAVLASRAEGEMPDDGQLSPWEKKRFLCLVALGRRDEAYSFGEAQCADAEDRGDLAYAAWQENDMELALRFARAALELDPNEASALHVMAKRAELDDDVPGAIAVWERMMAATGWHIHVENIARVSLATGDLERARGCADKAVATGHHCAVAMQVRAQTRLLSGDREAALADAERAVACTPIEYRSLSRDTFGLLAGLRGEKQEARRLFSVHLRESKWLSAADRSLIGKVMEALAI
jgi:tetratricopeptide (TPR) repeat protein